MKIALISDTYWPRINGVTVSVDLSLQAFLRKGHSVKLWAPDYPNTQNFAPKTHNVARLPSFLLPVSKEDRVISPFCFRTFFRQLDEFKPDIIHSHGEFFASFLARIFSERQGIPFVMTAHTYFEQYTNQYLPALMRSWCKPLFPILNRHLFRRADAIIVPTQEMKTVLRRYNITSPISIIPTGISQTDLTSFTEIEKQTFLSGLHLFEKFKNKQILLTVSRIGKEKNLDFLLKSFEIILKTNPETVLLIVGDGPYKMELEEKIRSSDISDFVFFTGYVPRSELKFLYSLADVFVFASTSETQGLVTIEAMTCGLPVVAVGKMGTRTVMAGNNGGFMTDENANEFASRTVELLSNASLRTAKSAEAKKHAEQWSDNRMADQLIHLYDSILNRNEVYEPAGNSKTRFWDLSLQ